MIPFRQSFSYWCYGGRGVDDATLLREAAKIGFKGVELISPTLWPLAQDAGLEIVTHGAHKIEVGFNDATEHADLQAKVRAGLDLATKNRVANLIVFAGNRLSGLSDEDAAQIATEGLAPLAKDAEAAGVTLILELLNSKVDHKHYQGDHTDWVVSVCKAVGSPRLRALYDIYHMQIMEGDLIRTIGENHEWIGHYHTAGNPGRNDMDDTQEIHYPPIYRAIVATGYTGYVGHEFVPKGEPIAALKKAYDDCIASGR